MKKLFVALISAVLCFSLFAFVGCDDNDHQYDDAPEMKIGAKVAVSPNCTFDYQIDTADSTMTVHVTSIEVTLCDIHSVGANDVLSGIYYPYEYELKAYGTTDAQYSGTNLQFVVFDGHAGRSTSSEVSVDGSITWQSRIQSQVVFNQIIFSKIDIL